MVGAGMYFTDRREAGRLLGARLRTGGYERPVVLALPRGGVPVGYEVARVLDAPLDVLVVRKLGCPGRPELGLGAIAEDGIRVIDQRLRRAMGVTTADLEVVARAEVAELDRRVARYRGDRPPTDLAGCTGLIVDDGLATGSSARAAIQVARERGARRVVLAVPVAPAHTVEEMQRVADEVVCLATPAPFIGVGASYAGFAQTRDQEVQALLAAAAQEHDADGRADRPCIRRDVLIPVIGGPPLPGELAGPTRPIGTVVFAHGSGSSRLSPRNVEVARRLNRAGLATLLFDLLSPEEAADRRQVFDVRLLAARLVDATRWLRHDPEVTGPTIGYFGASTGAAAALWAAADLGGDVAAVVSRGGRPDLAAPRLAEVVAPTLLIVGANDAAVLELNRQAVRQLRCPTQLEVVTGASHLFEEAGALQRVAALARDWFVRHLAITTAG